jgi:MSHA pilin protein MshC
MIVAKNHRMSGFSLIEMLTVVILLGIIGVVALGRLGNQSGFEARGFFDDTVAAVRYAQKLAVSNGCNVRVQTTAGSYAVFWPNSGCTANDYTVPVPNPANRGQSYQNVNMPAGYALTVGNITFNSRGIRTDAAPDTFSLSDGTNTYTFDVHENTGLVEVTVTP